MTASKTKSTREFRATDIVDYLGEWAEDYDVDAIIADATVEDEHGVWWTQEAVSPGGLYAICERHLLPLAPEAASALVGVEVSAAFRAFREQLAEDNVRPDIAHYLAVEFASMTSEERAEYRDELVADGRATLAEIDAAIDACQDRDVRMDVVENIAAAFVDMTNEERAEYEDELVADGRATLAEIGTALDAWQEYEDATRYGEPVGGVPTVEELLARLDAYDEDDDDEALIDYDDTVEEWTEWAVIAGEMDVLTRSRGGHPVWTWVPDHRAEVPGTGRTYHELDAAREVFDLIDPMGAWLSLRCREARDEKALQLGRRFEVDLVCQTVRRSATGIESVRDEAVRLTKGFDIDRDEYAQQLLRDIVEYL